MEAISRDTGDVTMSPPKGFQHPLLQLMPYGPGAPRHLQQLEKALAFSFDETAPRAERVARISQLVSSILRSGGWVPDEVALCVEVLEHAINSLDSAVLHELLAMAYLKRDGYIVESLSHDCAFPGVPRVVRHKHSALEAVPAEQPSRDALLMWHRTVMLLQEAGEQELASLCADKLRASIRNLQLFLLHAELGDHYRSGSILRLEFFEGVGCVRDLSHSTPPVLHHHVASTN